MWVLPLIGLSEDMGLSELYLSFAELWKVAEDQDDCPDVRKPGFLPGKWKGYYRGFPPVLV